MMLKRVKKNFMQRMLRGFILVDFYFHWTMVSRSVLAGVDKGSATAKATALDIDHCICRPYGVIAEGRFGHKRSG